MFGNININYINTYKDINIREFIILLLLLIPILIIGIYSPFITNILEYTCQNIILLINNKI
jgi:NADH:ubiquinone oxidoreductase subunit 4 (subunit M)